MVGAAQTKALNREIFDRAAGSYDAQGWGRFTLPLLQHVLGVLKMPEGGSLLDVGCGTGAFLEAVTQKQSANLSGLDLSPEMIRLTGQRLGGKADLKVGDSEDLPWPDCTFDVVTCSSSFHHYPQPQQALSEMRRVLKPGGQLVLADFWLPAPLRQFTNAFVIPRAKGGDVWVYSRREITAMLAGAGFQVVSWRRIGRWNYVAEAKTV